MTLISEKKTPEQITGAIFALDLSPIKFKLMDKKEGHGWTREHADRIELEYKRFLALLAKFPDEVIAPTGDVDKFWHGHILDTMKYAEDCENTFGEFLHHFPYFGMRGQEDAARLAEAAVKMRRLYREEFGAELDRHQAGDAAYCIRSNAAEADASYCIRASRPAVDASYCIRAGAPVDASYCIRASRPALDASYCIRAGEPDVSYCIRANDKLAKMLGYGKVLAAS